MLLVLAAAGCVRAPATSAPRTDRSLLTQQQLLEHHFNNVYEAVEALRPRWLQSRGPNSFRTPGEVLVYQDDNLLGGVDQLRSVMIPTVVYVRYYDSVQATARWGVGHSQGVIYISTRY
jgi:hypothetical protein